MEDPEGRDTHMEVTSMGMNEVTKERTPQGGRDTKETKQRVQLGEGKTRRAQYHRSQRGCDELHN